MKAMNRRTLLRGARGVALGLPALDAMLGRAARAQGVEPLRRLVIVYTPNGSKLDTSFL